MEKGIFEKKVENLIIGFLCDKINFRNRFLQMIKKPAITMMVKYGDNSFIDNLPEEYKTELRRIISLVSVGEYNQARGFITDFLNKKIQIKGMNEPDELEMFDHSTKLILIWLGYALKKELNQ